MTLLTSTPVYKCKCAHCTHLKEQEDCEGQDGDYKDYEAEDKAEDDDEDGENGDYEDYEAEDEDDYEHDSDPPQSKFTDAEFASGLQEEPEMQPKTREKLLALAATEGDVHDKTLHPMLQRITIDIEATLCVII